MYNVYALRPSTILLLLCRELARVRQAAVRASWLRREFSFSRVSFRTVYRIRVSATGGVRSAGKSVSVSFICCLCYFAQFTLHCVHLLLGIPICRTTPQTETRAGRRATPTRDGTRDESHSPSLSRAHHTQHIHITLSTSGIRSAPLTRSTSRHRPTACNVHAR